MGLRCQSYFHICRDDFVYDITRVSRIIMEIEPQHRAPALEKGLDILEALAEQRGGLLQKEVADRVGRSVSEVFRVLGALERRGYIARDSGSGLYTLTLKMFELAHIHPPTRRLIEIATTKMETLATQINCTCHLVIRHGNRLMVIAQTQPDTLEMGWSVRVGGVLPMSPRYASARTLAAFQKDHQREAMLSMMLGDANQADQRALEKKLENVRIQGYLISPSELAPGITDISCPILNHFGDAIAALTAPTFGPHVEDEAHIAEVVGKVRATADAISIAIGGQSLAQVYE
ncbi:transcriptional regulator [Pseudomonas daroniae]|uniref:Transcriptional regulator n=2 Tax=Pseudomonadales TaxID=72274 RepID=A0A4Q9QSQ6_9GAMM|nr:transcriptional regulator [Pseudomonas daroniae]TBU85110.1 transcriptional regulator [Pseudomonas sp. FRB 228]TBU93597.1 transcriptional regulator [Pseudomonas daroniae]